MTEKHYQNMATPNNENKGCLTAILQAFGITSKAKEVLSEQLPYRTRDDFLSSAELSFYRVLLSVVGSRFTVCSKVRLADIFFVTRPNENLAYFNRISQRHVDFLLCQPDIMKPILGIELDDSSHKRSDRQKRDEFVDSVFKAARLPLVRIPVQRAYNTQDLAARLSQVLSVTTNAVEATKAKTSPAERKDVGNSIATPPNCPKCGSPMVVRTVKKGEHQGKKFYGCPNFPKCRGMLPLQ